MTAENGDERRILALYLPRLLIQIVQGTRLSLNEERRPPLAVVLVDSEQQPDLEEAQVRPTDPLTAVSARAEKAGVRPGQSSTEACAYVANLQVQPVEKAQVQDRLIALAEVASRYGTTVSWAAPDTIWLDVTGVAHLFGGEEALAQELHEQVRLLGHVARVVVANGPLVARAVAKYSAGRSTRVVTQPRELVRQLPLSALPLDAERIAWLGKLGLFEVGQVADLPAKTASARLGPQALLVLELAAGVDKKPLVPGVFPQVLTEELEWEEPAEGVSPLLFALRGLVARLSARLNGRGEASAHLEVELFHDRAIARHRGVLSQTLLAFELSTPLYRESDLERVVRSRFERLELSAPTVGLRLRALSLTPQSMNQMGLSTPGASAWSAGTTDNQELPVLIAELSADVGAEGVGTLAMVHTHRPEKRSVLEPLSPQPKKKRRKKQARAGVLQTSCPQMNQVTRLLPHPQPVRAQLKVGETFGLGTELYTIESLRFLQRLDGVEWWTNHAANRDYLWAWLSSAGGGTEALLFVDRQSGQPYLQALND